jgi:hypothetical protein
MNSSSKKWDKSHFPVNQIKVANENNYLYDRFAIANHDDQALYQSIKEVGIQEPLVITLDNYLLSGHRRISCARRLGHETVPVRIIDKTFESLDKPERLALLRLYNQQRDKSTGEKIREKLLEIDKSEAHSKLLRRRVDLLTVSGGAKSNIKMGDTQRRSKITTIQFLNAVKSVIEESKEYWPVTDRRVHYLLLNDPPLKHDKKPKSKYVNDKASYKALTNLLVRARLNDEIPMRAIEDGTRPIQLGGGFETLEQFVGQETQNYLAGYSRDLMQGQPHHIEILLEKNALRSIIESVARNYCIPVTTTRGYSSLSPRFDLVQRFLRSGKSKLILLMLTDFDPDGEQIAQSFARSLRDDFGLKNVHPVKVALTADDVKNHELPSDMDAKPTSPNYKKFIAEYGVKAVELDAAPVDLLKSSLESAIQSFLDMDEFKAQIDLEAKDAVKIEVHRQLLFSSISDFDWGDDDV